MTPCDSQHNDDNPQQTDAIQVEVSGNQLSKPYRLTYCRDCIELDRACGFVVVEVKEEK